MNIGIIIAAVLISLAIGVATGIAYRKRVAESKINSAEEKSKKIVNLAKIEAENLKKAKTPVMKSFIKSLTGGEIVRINNYLEKYPQDYKKVLKDITT